MLQVIFEVAVRADDDGISVGVIGDGVHPIIFARRTVAVVLAATVTSVGAARVMLDCARAASPA
jgi:hypothetical protein